MYEAEDLKLRRHVALKFLPPEMENDPAARGTLSARMSGVRTLPAESCPYEAQRDP